MHAPFIPATDTDPVLELTRLHGYTEPVGAELEALRPHHERVAGLLGSLATEAGIEPVSRYRLALTLPVEYVDGDGVTSYLYAERDSANDLTSLNALVRSGLTGKLKEITLYWVDADDMLVNMHGNVAALREVNRLSGTLGRMREDLKPKK